MTIFVIIAKWKTAPALTNAIVIAIPISHIVSAITLAKYAEKSHQTVPASLHVNIATWR